MGKKINSKVNGGMAIYYGFSSAAGALACIVGTCVWLFKVFTDQKSFSWGILVFFILMSVVLGAIAYSLLRIGYEELEE